MKKMKCLTLVLALALALLLSAVSVCRAGILEPQGPGQIGRPAVVLFDGTAMHRDRSADSEAVKTLRFGALIIAADEKDGWAECILSDSVDEDLAGWVDPGCLLIDPAWYMTDQATPVYAWNDTAAPQIVLLDKDTLLPILKNDGEWIVVSLPGAAGWIHIGGESSL